MLVAAISPEDDVPGQPALPRTATGQTIALRGSVAATPGPYGRIVIAGASAGEHTAPAGELLLTEGRADGPFASPTALGGPASTFAFTTAYLGDVAFASLIDAPPGSAAQPSDGNEEHLQAGHVGSVRPGSSPGSAGNDDAGDAGTGDAGAATLEQEIKRHAAARPAPPRRRLRRTGSGRRRGYGNLLRAGADGRARLPLGRARRVVCAGLALRSRAAGLRRAAASPATRPRPSLGRADRGCDQRRRSRDRRLDRTVTTGRPASMSAARSPAFASRGRSCSKNFPTPRTCPTTWSRPASCASPRRA